MKKVLSIFLAVALIVSLASISVFAADKTTINLVPKDLEWSVEAGNGYEATWTYDDNGKLTVASEGGWPNIKATYAEPIAVSLDDEITFDLKLASGNLNFNITLDVDGVEYVLYLHHCFGLDGSSYDSGSNDLIALGEYKNTIALKDATVSTDGVLGTLKTLPEDAKNIKITKIQIYAISGGTVEVNTFTVTTDAPVTDNPGTGEEIMVFALIALVAMGGAVVVSKKVR